MGLGCQSCIRRKHYVLLLQELFFGMSLPPNMLMREQSCRENMPGELLVQLSQPKFERITTSVFP